MQVRSGVITTFRVLIPPYYHTPCNIKWALSELTLLSSCFVSKFLHNIWTFFALLCSPLSNCSICLVTKPKLTKQQSFDWEPTKSVNYLCHKIIRTSFTLCLDVIPSPFPIDAPSPAHKPLTKFLHHFPYILIRCLYLNSQYPTSNIWTILHHTESFHSKYQLLRFTSAVWCTKELQIGS